MIFNYKEYFQIELFALVDDKYIFVAINVGSYGKEGDAGTVPKSTFGKSIATETFPFPNPIPMLGCSIERPRVIICDDVCFQVNANIFATVPK